MTVTVDQGRLLTPPRIAHFCPAKHCARACGPEDCTCKPCRCPDCRKPVTQLCADTFADLPLPNRQPHLFTERSFK